MTYAAGGAAASSAPSASANGAPHAASARIRANARGRIVRMVPPRIECAGRRLLAGRKCIRRPGSLENALQAGNPPYEAGAERKSDQGGAHREEHRPDDCRSIEPAQDDGEQDEHGRMEYVHRKRVV